MSMGDNVQVILGAIGPFWAKWGLGRVPRSAIFFLCGKTDDLSGTSQRPISTKFGHETLAYFGVPSRNPKKPFSKIFTLGVICPQKSEIENWSNRHLTQSRLQVTGCIADRYCLLHVVVQGPGSFLGLINYSLRRRAAELRDVKVANFF